jgi:valyl-tRNA synthetase
LDGKRPERFQISRKNNGGRRGANSGTGECDMSSASNKTNGLAKGYEPGDVETRWYDFWIEKGLFHAEETGDKPTYGIVIPPPNVTGVLHMGHALNNTLQDALCRYKRLRGFRVLWMPGTDHAGIATQNVVERKLAREGTDRHALGREKFIERVWGWRKEYGGAIINQLKKLGSSCDWERERFTMDEGLSRAVRKVFVQLYEEGLIYRGQRIINWCPRCNTALADLEVEHEELDGHLYQIRYPFAEGEGGIVVATTRPETMLGDTAVAVHPEDERYENLPSDAVILPLMERRIPVIRDPYVDKEFGTGGLKVTPAHDPNDFEIGRRHNLPSVKAIDDEGRMTEETGRFAGMDRFECRKAVLKELEEKGLLVTVEDLRHSVGHCYRCSTVVEPNLSLQWFVKAKPLADKAIAAVKDGRTRIIPDMWERTYFDWLENIRDWCISRQIWWGHQIPAWTCEDCEKVTVTMEDPDRCSECGSEKLVRETDVLDTWFSSALWPFSTMGWPDKTPLLESYYPTSTLVTAFDILFFWVARMMMMGIHFMEEVPFRDVYVHALVRDEDGQKMSKSKGNVIDPLTVVDKHGADAFRFTLAAFAAQGRDVRMSVNRVEGYRHFINKLWNAARFALMHLEEFEPGLPDAETAMAREDGAAAAPLSLADRWILSRLRAAADASAEGMEAYKFNEAAGALYQFLWHEFCDWYLEAAKPTLYGNLGDAERDTARTVLWRTLRESLILLHPFIPFVTEEIWHKLPGTSGSIMEAVYPTDNPGNAALRRDAAAEADMETVMAVITGVRNVRGEMNIQPSLSLPVKVQAEDAAVRELLDRERAVIVDLARLSSFDVEAPGERPRAAATAVTANATVFVSLEGIIDFSVEAGRLEKERGKVEKELSGVSKKLNNEDFLAKAPDDVVAKVRERHEALSEKYEKLTANLERIRELAEDGGS